MRCEESDDGGDDAIRRNETDTIARPGMKRQKVAARLRVAEENDDDDSNDVILTDET
jgi:hypothetical protein